MIGSIIDGKYRIIRELGAGAMGAVFMAEHTGTGGRVALKVISGDYAHDTDTLGRFQREAKAAGIVDSQYITKVFDTGVDQATDTPYLVMEMLSGQDLGAFLKDAGPVSPDLALRIIAQACIGLQKAHAANVVHRDIKPSNIFLHRREEGEVIVKLLDFGIAKVMMDQAQDLSKGELTKTGHMLGSPLYMSPEQALGDRDIDHRSDIWSLGIALYQALCGRTPFNHVAALGLLIVEICSGKMAPVQQFAPWVHPDVAAVVHGALQRNRADRFQSAAEMLAAIKRLLPQGFALHESMLVPLHASARAQVQPRLPMPSAPSLPDAHLQALMPSAHASSAEMSSSTTTGALARSNTAASKPERKPRLVPMLGVGGSMIGIVSLIILGRAVLGRAPDTPSPQPSSIPSTEPVSLPTAMPTQVPTAQPAPTMVKERAPESADKHFRLVILPAFASVDVDGKPAEVKNGTVELIGPLGRVFKVRVYKNAYSNEEIVTISDQGLIPPKVDMYARQNSSSQGLSSSPQTQKKPIDTQEKY